MAERLRLVSRDRRIGHTDIFVGEQRIAGVRAIKLECSVDDVWRVTIELLPQSVDVDVPVDEVVVREPGHG